MRVVIGFYFGIRGFRLRRVWSLGVGGTFLANVCVEGLEEMLVI